MRRTPPTLVVSGCVSSHVSVTRWPPGYVQDRERLSTGGETAPLPCEYRPFTSLGRRVGITRCRARHQLTTRVAIRRGCRGTQATACDLASETAEPLEQFRAVIDGLALDALEVGLARRMRVRAPRCAWVA